MEKEYAKLGKVIDGGFCIGCGGCAFVSPDSFKMKLNDSGNWVPTQHGPGALGIEMLCPMSGESENETEIASRLFPGLPEDSLIGRYGFCGAGWVKENDFRTKGGSGGMVSWLLTKLIESGEVDGVIHVVGASDVLEPDEDVMFGYGVSESVSEIRRGAKSRYYPIEMSKVLEFLSRTKKRYAFVGIPCFVKALRLLQKAGKIEEGRVVYAIGLVCGHLKSKYFADLLAWQKGVEPKLLRTMDFRKKRNSGLASQYDFEMTYVNGDRREQKSYPMAGVIGKDWGLGLMKNFACEFCDDVMAECSDVVIGDAWLPKYVDDPRGANVVVVRNSAILKIFEDGSRSGALHLDAIEVADVIRSQSSGLSHRREGLGYRLSIWGQNKWVPRKRVEPSSNLSNKRKSIYKCRLDIAAYSSSVFFEAMRVKSFDYFMMTMKPMMDTYSRLYFWDRVKRKAKKVHGSLLAKLSR
ncbi:Coenzyme F420 hydrogenase/dehydrogenase, beta subunit C-terminal domain [Puniceicoccaceae bacterium K14]|nr:Coenzyme F420 hydrogenase/dehydrogenase, beta subunit C-terminal domain [Puniceicoccaceae bacterium K14]